MNKYNLSQKDFEKLQEINTRVLNLQKKLINEASKLDALLSLRVADSNDPLDDYEIEMFIDFYLREDDPCYKVDEDNFITSITEYLKGVSKDQDRSSWRWDANHNEFRGRSNHPMHNEHHCWWFHCLYDHNNLEWNEILKIGAISSDIKVHYQYYN